MNKILEIFTFQGGYMGGVATMVKSYMDGVEEFADHDCALSNLNIAPIVHTGLKSIDNFAYIFTQRKAVRKHLREHSYDVVHIHTSREFLFLKDVFLAKLINTEYGISVVLTIHVGAMETVYNRIGWFKDKSITILNKYVSKTIFLSKAMRVNFIEAGLNEQKSTVLYNFHNFTPTTMVPEIKDGLQILYVGAIHREKGILELLHAIDQMPNLKCHLNICGKLTDNSIKAELESLEAKLSGRVSFLGYVTGEEKTILYQQSDLLILPSYHEGLPLVVLEALGAGCGIITTPVGAIPEILNEENCRWLEVASSQSIVLQLLNLTEGDLNLMKSQNKLLGNYYSFETHVRKLSEIYNMLRCPTEHRQDYGA